MNKCDDDDDEDCVRWLGIRVKDGSIQKTTTRIKKALHPRYVVFCLNKNRALELFSPASLSIAPIS